MVTAPFEYQLIGRKIFMSHAFPQTAVPPWFYDIVNVMGGILDLTSTPFIMLACQERQRIALAVEAAAEEERPSP